MSIITKRVTMTDKAWEALNEAIAFEHGQRMIDWEPRKDTADAITALAEAEVIAVSETYSERK